MRITERRLRRLIREALMVEADMPGMQGTPLAERDKPDLGFFTENNMATSGHLALLAANDDRNDIPGAYADVANLRRFIETKEQFAKFLHILVEVADEVIQPGSESAFADAIKDSMPPKWYVNFDFNFLRSRLAGTDRSSFAPGAVMEKIREMANKYSDFYDPATKFNDAGGDADDFFRAEPGEIEAAATKIISYHRSDDDKRRLLDQLDILEGELEGREGWLDTANLEAYDAKDAAEMIAQPITGTELGIAVDDLRGAIAEIRKQLEGAVGMTPVEQAIERFKDEGRDSWDRASNDFHDMANGGDLGGSRARLYPGWRDEDFLEVAEALDAHFGI